MTVRYIFWSEEMLKSSCGWNSTQLEHKTWLIKFPQNAIFDCISCKYFVSLKLLRLSKYQRITLT